MELLVSYPRILRIAWIMLAIMGGLLITGGFSAQAQNVDFSQSRSLPIFSKDIVVFENVIVGSDRYWAVMQWNSSSNVFLPIRIGILNKVEIPFRTIVIDGKNDDWTGIQPIVNDPPGDENPLYAAVPGTDLATVYMAHDDTYLYFLMTFHDGNPIEDAMYVVEFQQCLTQLHSPGDRFAFAQKVGGTWSVRVHDRGGWVVTSYPSDHANSGTGMLEWKVRIVDLKWPPDTPHPYFPPAPVPEQGIDNRFVRAYIHPGPHPNFPPLSDENDALTRPMIVNFGR
jgi:hypothetical protein